MKRIKDFLDFIISLASAWKIVLPMFLFVLSAAVAVFKFGTQRFAINLPVWAILIIVILALYLFAKLIETFAKRKKVTYTKLYGLFWKPSLFSFQYPRPFCPHANCGKEIISKALPPNPVRLVTNITDINNMKFEYQYIYECPIHGRLNGVPSEDINILQEKAKLAMKK